MSVSAALLRQIHRIHQQLADLTDRLERGPRQILARENGVAALEADLAACQLAVQQTKLAADKKQLELKTGENKIEDLKVKLNQASSNKEFHSFQEQIAASQMANSVLADEILEAFERVDQLTLSVGEAKAKVQTAKNELSRFRDQVVVEGTTIRADIERLQGELSEAERTLPGDFRDDYRRVLRGKGADAMALAEDGVCQGCGRQITLNMQNQLLLSEPVLCKSCGRILYPPER